MWDAIAKHCQDAGNTFTLYIDDLTISGRVVLGETLWKVRREVHKHGLKIKASKTRLIIGRPADVTGVIVDGDSLRFPNRQHRKLVAAEAEFSRPGGNREKKANQVKGRRAQKKQVLSGNALLL